MASDEEYVNYNGDDSRDGYHDFTENNNTDQAAGQNHPIERRVPKRTHAGGYSSKKREVSLYDEDMYSLPTGTDVNSTKESQLEDVMETLGDISNRIENQNEKTNLVHHQMALNHHCFSRRDNCWRCSCVFDNRWWQ